MTTTVFGSQTNAPTPPVGYYRKIPSPFAMDENTFQQLGQRIIGIAAEYLRGLPDEPVYQPIPDEERELIQGLALPCDGWSEEAILDFYLQHVFPWQRSQNHPRFAAFVDPAASPMSMLAAFLSAVTNNSATGGNYATAYVEQTTVRWLMELIGFPIQGSDGVLLHGGSDANRHGIEVARYWGAQAHGWNVREEGLVGHPRLVMYVSPERHSCIDKASYTLGLGKPCEVPADRNFRMDVGALRAAIARDRAAGYCPFLVVASASTVRTGAIDPLDELADVCAEENLWLHVDGAFGGLGAVNPRLATLYKGIERADSVAIDPHKWLATAIGCSCVFVRRGQLLQDTYKLVHDYLKFQSGNVFASGPWYSHRSAAQTRDSGPALKAFWNIQLAGRSGIVAHVSRHIDLARYMEALIEASPDLEFVASGPLPAVCFRYVPKTLRGQELQLNELNQAVMGRLQIEGRAFLAGVEIAVDEEEDRWTGLEIGGRYALRSCAMHYALTEEHVEAIVNEVRRVGELCLAEKKPVEQ